MSSTELKFVMLYISDREYICGFDVLVIFKIINIMFNCLLF